MALTAGLVTAAAGLAGCGSSASAAPGRAATSHPTKGPPLRLAVSAYPLAQLVAYIGGTYVHVVNLVPAAVQPQGLALTASGRAQLRSAALVIDVGDGYQPDVEAAAKAARHYLSVLPAVSRQAQPYEFWLDPYLMAKAAIVIAAAMTAADPAGRRQFENGSRDFQSVADSIESDFESTFTQCASSYFVTADDAFGRMATSFGLVDVAVSTAGVAGAISALSAHKLPAVFSEQGASSSLVQEVAERAGVKVKTLDTMELTPAPGAAAQSYFAAMEQDLTVMEGPLACDPSDDFS